jgi:hypothetical protein
MTPTTVAQLLNEGRLERVTADVTAAPSDIGTFPESAHGGG